MSFKSANSTALKQWKWNSRCKKHCNNISGFSNRKEATAFMQWFFTKPRRMRKTGGYKMIALAFLLVVMLPSTAFTLGKTVQLNLAFSIGAKDDNITVGSSFVSASDSSVVLSIVSSGTATNTGNTTAYSSSEYLLQVTQATENNRFLIAFTNGTNQTIMSRINLLGSRKILARTFGDLPARIPESFMAFLRLEYDDVDIISRTRWSANPFQLIIRNEGPNDRGVAQVSIEMVK